MNKIAITRLVLLFTLVTTNVAWFLAYRSISPPISSPAPPPYVSDNSEINVEQLLPLKNVIAASTIPGATKESIVRAADGDKPIFIDCLHGQDAVRVRGIALYFNPDGKLVSAGTGNCYF